MQSMFDTEQLQSRARAGCERAAALAIVLGVLVLGLLATPVVAQNPTGKPDDHFLCYKGKTSKFTKRSVSLADTFESKSYDVKKSQLLCNPAGLNGGGIVDDVTHLMAYKIKEAKDEPKDAAQAGLRVINAVGDFTVDTIKPDLLLVPSAKDLTVQPPPPDPKSHNVDHFKCYKIKASATAPKFAGTTVAVQDQFLSPGSKDLDLKKPTHLCTAVDKNGEGIKNVPAQLLCFKAKPAKGQPKHVSVTANVNNQLDPLTIETKKESLFCVPPSGVHGATINIPSGAEPAQTPGTMGVSVTNPNLITQFGGTSFSLNNARYTRFRLDGSGQPDAILILVPGFEGGANDFKILAENLITRSLLHQGLVVEVWAFDRRSNQLEDMAGLEIAESLLDPFVAVDWMFGGELALPLDPALVAGPNRRAVFYNAQSDVPFIANWTPLVFSRDIDAVVEAARGVARNQNVFLGGHSAGTGFTARYASTDFNLTGAGPAQPGYAKLRGLVLLEGGGGSTAGAPLTSDSLDRIIAKFDGGLFGAVRDNAARCVDGVTACTIATEATDCMGQTPPKCTPAAPAYSIVTGLLNPRILAASEAPAIQSATDPDTGEGILTVDQGAPGNNPVAKVPDLATLAVLPKATAEGGIGSFVDDDGLVAAIASFVATSVGAPGPVVGGLQTWLDITEGPMPPSVVPNNGPAPTTLPAGKWGQEKEVTRMDRLLTTFYVGGTNFTDWYYPSSGLSVTSASGVCSGNPGTCLAGNVGAACSGANQTAADATCNQAINLDSTALSIGRGRRDIENLTQAPNINIPVIAFGGTNGLATVPGVYVPFGQSIGLCTAPSCNGSTTRVVDASNPNPAFPTLGGVNGGYEVYMNEGFAHVDVLTAEDNADNNVLAPLAAFIARNVQ